MKILLLLPLLLGLMSPAIAHNEANAGESECYLDSFGDEVCGHGPVETLP